MKKVIATLMALLLAALIAVSVLPLGLPSSSMVSDLAGSADGTVYMAENRSLVSRIYTLRGGDVAEIYEEFRLKGQSETEIVQVAAGSKGCLLVRTAPGANTADPMDSGDCWELERINGEEKTALGGGIFEVAMDVTGLSFRGDQYYVTGLGYNEGVFIYESDGSAAQLKLILPLWWVMGATGAEYDGVRTYITDKYGDYYSMTNTGERTYLDDMAESSYPELSLSASGWFLCKKTVLLATVLIWLVVSITVLVTAFTCRRAHQLATRITAVAGETVLLTLFLVLGFLFYAMRQRAGLYDACWTIRPAVITAAAIWLASLLILWIVARHITILLPVLAAQMEKISDGSLALREVTDGKDELHCMDRSMQEMCMALSIRDYELQCTVRSYQRFVPEKLTHLLSRANVMEVGFGDSQRVEGTVGLFTVGNRDLVRASLEDADFVEFINHCFGTLDVCLAENEGHMLSNGLRLSLMETMFPRSAVDGVQAGLDFQGHTREKSMGGLPSPRPFLMLHSTSFLYGVAGQEDRLFPYVSSAELEFLGSFAQKFYEADVRIVVTEACWKQLDNRFVGRYIGFVSDGEKGQAYKLYEILDAYSELDRDLRKGYDERFQEALNLFYKNDFYLARNLFSSLLRACPEDGIVRWYLFASERYFNQTGDFEADYRLFGTEE